RSTTAATTRPAAAAWVASRCATPGRAMRYAAATAAARAWAMSPPTTPPPRPRPTCIVPSAAAATWRVPPAARRISASTSATAAPSAARAPPRRAEPKGVPQCVEKPGTRRAPCFFAVAKAGESVYNKTVYLGQVCPLRCGADSYQKTRRLTVSQPTKLSVPFVSFRPMEKELDGDLRAAFDRVLQNSWYIEGREDEAFEAAFARYCGTAHCVGCGNGLDALVLILKAMGIGPGDEVIVP